MYNDYWRDAEDDENLICRSVSVDGRIQIGLYRVLYGWRVRGGWVHDKWGVTLDWCCGDNHVVLSSGYKIMLAAIQSARKKVNPFGLLPDSSKIKPITRDVEFLSCIFNEIDVEVVSQIISLKLPAMTELDQRALQQQEFSTWATP